MNGFFNLHGFKDLFEKCKFDLAMLDKRFLNLFEYTLFNLVCSLNHLFEWFLKDSNPEISKSVKHECILEFYPYDKPQNKKYIKKIVDTKNTLPQKNLNQFLVRCLCNGAKHFSKSEEIVTKFTKEFTMVCGSPTAYCGNPNAVAGAHDVHYFVQHDGTEYDAVSVCSELLKQWDEFFKQHNVI